MWQNPKTIALLLLIWKIPRLLRAEEVQDQQAEADLYLSRMGRLEPVPDNEELTEDDVIKLTEPFATRIVGGHDAIPHSYPGIVAMKIRNSPACGGAIYNKDWVVSAAHCVISSTPSQYKFVAGEHDTSRNEGTEQERTATKVVKHEGYDSSVFKNDIALWKVSPPFTFDNNVKASVLAPKGWSKMGSSTAIGWGRTSQGGSSPKILQEVNVPIMTNTDCGKAYGAKNIFPTSLCAGFPQGGKDACQGDSGGPLYFKEGGNLIQIGLTSWGIGCAKPNNPGVYTRLSEYRDWIEANAGSPERMAGVPDAPAGGDNPLYFSSAMAQNICQQLETYKSSKAIQAPVKDRPPEVKGPVTWYSWTKCFVAPCNPFEMC